MSIRASASACDITPEDPLPLAGWTGSKRISGDTSSPLYASAVHIRGGAGGCIILSLDLWTLDPLTSAVIRQKVSTATGTRKENVFIAVTGCTSAPYTEEALYLKNDPSFALPDKAYMEMVVSQSVKAASEAAVSSRPASMALVPLARHGTGALIIKGENGRVIAAVIVKDDSADYLGSSNSNISSDFTGYLRTRLTSRFGGDPVIAYIPAPCADLILETRHEYGTAPAEAAGKALSDELIAGIKTLKASDFISDFTVNGSITELHSIQRRTLPQITDALAMLNAAGKSAMTMDSAQDPAQRKLAKWSLIEANRTMSMVIAFKEGTLEAGLQAYDPVILQSISIGPVKIIGVPCCMLRNTAQQIMSKAGPGVWLAQGVNGTMMGSLFSSSGSMEDLRGRLLSPVFERDTADKLTNAIIKTAAEI